MMPKPRATPLASNPAVAAVAFGGLLCVAVLGLFLIDLRDRYDAVRAEAHRATESYAAVQTEHTARTFEAVDRVLLRAIKLKKEVADSGVAWDSSQDAMRQLVHSAPAIDRLGWTDAHGNLTMSSASRQAPRINVAEQPYFPALRDTTQLRVVISPP